ncbi:MAG: hypothetical protein K9J30_03460 [Bacteroidales bacterium]|nr:hypothetical protein [Bacteroidales bacterium]
MQQFIVEFFVKCIAIIGKRELQLMLWGKDFIYLDKLFIIFLRVIFHNGFIVPEIKPGNRNIDRLRIDERFCDFIVEKIRFCTRKASRFKFFKVSNKFPVFGKYFFKFLCIEDVPLVKIGGDEMFNFKVFIGDSFSEVVQNKFVNRLGIDVFPGRHFCLVSRSFGFNDNSNSAFSIFTIVNYKVSCSFRIDVVIGLVIGVL